MTERLIELFAESLGTRAHPAAFQDAETAWHLMQRILRDCAFPEGFKKQDARRLAAILQAHRDRGAY